MTEQHGMSQGGFVTGEPIPIHVEPAGQCPNGHAQYRINGSPHVEHVAPASDPDIVHCQYAVEYKPKD